MDNKRHILLIDDDLQIKILVEQYLKELPIEIHYAKNGFDAFEVVQDLLLELVILDVSMPIMNGFNFLKRLRNIKTHDDIPILILTSSDEKKEVIKFAKMKVAGYLIKPPKKEAFIEKVKSLIVI